MTAEDLTIIEKAGRRCSGCHTGRHWRRLEVLRPEGRDPLVTCRACRPRLTAAAAAAAAAAADAPAAPTPAPDSAPRTQAATSSAPAKRRPRRGHRPSSPQREDRLKRALHELPAGPHSVARIAKAAGLNEKKVLSRLRALEAAGEVQRIGNRWTTERPSTDLEAAFDRLQARTANLRIIRPDRHAD